MRRTSDIFRATICGSIGAGYTSTIPWHTVAPANWRISSAARSAAGRATSGWMPRLKRMLASLGRLSALMVRRMLRKSKLADSRRTLVVVAETSVSAPPMTPASATGPAPSAMTSISGVSLRSTPSSVFSVSPARAGRTVIVGALPPARAASLS